jgi:hypothetical protein
MKITHGVVANLLTLARREKSVANLLDEHPTRVLAVNLLRHHKPIPIVGGVIQCVNNKIVLRRFKDNTIISLLHFETKLLISANYPRGASESFSRRSGQFRQRFNKAN